MAILASAIHRPVLRFCCSSCWCCSMEYLGTRHLSQSRPYWRPRDMDTRPMRYLAQAQESTPLSTRNDS